MCGSESGFESGRGCERESVCGEMSSLHCLETVVCCV